MKKPKLLRPVHPNAGLQAAYRKKLTALVDEMHNSILHWLPAAWKRNEPEIAADELPATTMKKAIRDLQRRWQHRFDDAAPELARYFAQAANKRSDKRLQAILKDNGFSVKFKMTRAQQDVLHATINQNVALIKSIPRKYLADVEGAVMRSVQTGRDLESLTRELQASYGVTKRRAAFIARDQNNKATASLQRARQIEIGIKQAVWIHSAGGKVPRPSHVKAGRDRVVYDVTKGWFDPDEEEWILPGELINCRCVSRSVVPGFGA